MAARIDTPFTNEHFVHWCEGMAGQPYWYGTAVYKCTNNLLKSKTRQYPNSYGSSRTARYKKDIAAKLIAADCVGGAKGYAWTGGGIGVLEAIGNDNTYTSHYGANGCPDKSANGMFEYAKSKGMPWGKIGSMPELPGIALRFDGHVGYYIGNGYAIEWRGFAYGCVKTKVADRKWTHWYRLPFIDYGEEKTEVTLGSRELKKGMTGTDVKEMQTALMKLGYSLPKYGADADFGSETEKAVIAFQKKAGITADGIYNEETHSALTAALLKEETGTVVEISDAVSIRTGNGEEYDVIATAETGATYQFVATACNGWHAIVVNRQVGWVPGENSKII